MHLGQRIELKRQEIGISQAELARRVGIRQSTMNSLINGTSRTTRSLVAIARELRTTPAYLMGETDDSSLTAPEFALNGEEQGFVQLLRSMDPLDRRAMLRLARSLAGQPGTAVHERQHAYRGD